MATLSRLMPSLACVLAACHGATASGGTSDAPADAVIASSSPPALSAAVEMVPPSNSAAAPSAHSAEYDLASDLAVRLDAARADLGPGAVDRVEGDVFLIVAAHGGWPFDPSVALAHDALPPLFDGRFRRRPDLAVTAFVFPSDGPYQGFCGKHFGKACPSPYGFFERKSRALVVDAGAAGVTTLTHEMVHVLVRSDFEEAPAWINEGLATLFEVPVITPDGQIHGGKNKRHDVVRDALRSRAQRETMRVDALFDMSDDQFRGPEESLHTALAHDVCQWLDDRGKLWPFYREWRDHVDEDRTGVRSFVKVVGKSPKDANHDWMTWESSRR